MQARASALQYGLALLCALVLLYAALVTVTSDCLGSWCSRRRNELQDSTSSAPPPPFLPLQPLPEDCAVPEAGFKAWRRGTVTQMVPEVLVNCSRAVAGDERELKIAKTLMSAWKNGISDAEMLKRVKYCDWLREYFDDNLYNSKLEKSFPLAFTFVVYDSPQQVLRLLRLMYKPQNSYCIHYDSKSHHKEFFASVARCFHNVIIPRRLERVVWSHYSILGAQMSCTQDLLRLRTTQVSVL